MSPLDNKNAKLLIEFPFALIVGAEFWRFQSNEFTTIKMEQ